VKGDFEFRKLKFRKFWEKAGVDFDGFDEC
jgi:hypothetical protein